MKKVIIQNQVFTSKPKLIDFAGYITACYKDLPKNELRDFGEGCHFGKEFTLTVKGISQATNTDKKKLEALARSLGATDKQIADCTNTITKAGAVSFSANKPK